MAKLIDYLQSRAEETERLIHQMQEPKNEEDEKELTDNEENIEVAEEL